MSEKKKMTKDVVPSDYTMGLALVDFIPVLFFGINTAIIGAMINSPLFIIGSVICFVSGFIKVLWKIIVVKKKKNIWWMFLQMRIFMPVGFLMLPAAFVIDRKNVDFASFGEGLLSFPAIIFFILYVAGMVLMMVFAKKLDSSDAKSNWIEQLTNGAAHIFFMIGLISAYLTVCYHAEPEAMSYITTPSEGITVDYKATDHIAFIPDDIKAGIIFYPGAKVEFTAYTPILSKLSENGILCIIVKMPCNMAILNPSAADKYRKMWPEVTDWYMAGHSLGGAVSGMYLAKTDYSYDGVIFLAAYSSSDISSKDLRVLSVYGSNDGVLKAGKYEQYRSNLPADFTEHVIEGGCHAYFGMYGAQKGDGTPTISAQDQWDETVETILNWMDL